MKTNFEDFANKLTGVQTSTAISFLALFISLGGTGYAVTSLPQNSVGTKQIRDNAVTRSKIQDKAVSNGKITDSTITSSKLRNGTITTSDINASLYKDLLGPTGPLGPQGLPGIVGATGQAGTAGAGGAPGAAGAPGTPGTPGTPGADGAAGAAGAAGAPGADGRTVLNGDGAPSSGIGATGDFYIDTSSSSISGPKSGGVWGTATSLIGPQGPSGEGVTPYYGSFSSGVTQTTTPANTAIPMRLDTDELTGHGISRVNPLTGAEVRIEHTGVYNIQFSAQIAKTDAGTDTIDIWLQINGVNVPRSNSTVTLASATDRALAAWNFVYAFTANETFNLAMSSADPDFQILAVAGSSGPVRPAVPGLILTATRIG
jgi:hypothetical protein